MTLNASDTHPGAPPLSRLSIADPETAGWVRRKIEKIGKIPSAGDMDLMEETLILGLSQETALGRAMADGFLLLAAETDSVPFGTYARLVTDSMKNGPALATILATHLGPVLKSENDRLLALFLETVAAIRRHGTYTLSSPLQILPGLLNRLGPEAAMTYLSLLLSAFGRELAYDRCKLLVHLIPRAVAGFTDRRCIWQMRAFKRVIDFDVRLVEPFLKGMAAATAILKEAALERFVSDGLEKAAESLSKGERFLSLESQVGIETLKNLRVGVTLGDLGAELTRYLRARTAMAIPVRPICGAPGPGLSPEVPTVLCDGQAIFLPREMEVKNTREENIELYKHLTKMEAGLVEFGTFDFDMDRFRQYSFEKFTLTAWTPPPGTDVESPDLARFFDGFKRPDIAEALFTIFEHRRIGVLSSIRYPGMWARTLPTFQNEAKTLYGAQGPASFLNRLYWTVALGLPDRGGNFAGDTLSGLRERFEEMVKGEGAVETSALMCARVYPDAEAAVKREFSLSGKSEPFVTPFQRKIRWDLFFESHRAWEVLAQRIKQRLAEKHIPVHRSQVRKALQKNNGALDPDTLSRLIQSDGPGGEEATGEAACAPAGSPVDLVDLLGEDLREAIAPEPEPPQGNVFWYREWDERAQDYLHRHVRVLERRQPEGEMPFYERVLTRHSGLVGLLRHAFELMRPEGLVILRPWMEGDAFDYLALVEAAIDRRIGRIPSERLYIHRLKQQRDVAVLLLVDLSRSTASKAAGSDLSVLEVEKQAIVLFCEALSVLGDRFAVAGFSGNGRLAVEYLWVKDFDEGLSAGVRNRIGCLSPRRNTRMGAAIRHATAHLTRIPAKVRLLMVLGDGFPNDSEYKKAHAVNDTRRSIAEATSLGIHTHAITVNMAADPQLDALYGRNRHTVISDVRELPEKLHRIYSRLTR